LGISERGRRGQTLREIGAAHVKKPKHLNRRLNSLSPEDARRLLDFAQGHRLETLFTVAVSMGLREGEAFALRWSDVDLDRGLLQIRHSLDRTSRPWRLETPKTDRSRRSLTVPAVCRLALAAHKERQAQEQIFQGSRWQHHDFVFSSSIGTPLDCNNVLKQFRAILKQAGIAERCFHDLRHTCATLLLSQGVHARVVMEMLGHSSIAVTMNTYSHVMRPMQDDAATKMDAVLTSPTALPEKPPRVN